MRLITIITLFFFLNSAQAQTWLGGGGICHVAGNPNQIALLEAQDVLNDCYRVYDFIGKEMYSYHPDSIVGRQWVADATYDDTELRDSMRFIFNHLIDTAYVKNDTLLMLEYFSGEKDSLYFIYPRDSALIDSVKLLRVQLDSIGVLIDTTLKDSIRVLQARIDSVIASQGGAGNDAAFSMYEVFDITESGSTIEAAEDLPSDQTKIKVLRDGIQITNYAKLGRIITFPIPFYPPEKIEIFY